MKDTDVQWIGPWKVLKRVDKTLAIERDEETYEVSVEHLQPSWRPFYMNHYPPNQT